MSNLRAFILCLLCVLFFGCPDSGVSPPTNPLQLSVLDIGCTEVTLQLSLAVGEVNRNILLKRNDSTIASIAPLRNDSVVVDTALLPGKPYGYSLVQNGWSASAQITTLDTTTHAVQWEPPDSLGSFGNIWGVSILSRNDAWAVGLFYENDSTGKPDMGNPYNAAHWDGARWTIKKITVNFRGDMVTPELTGIRAFSPTEIWVTSGGSAIYGNGTNWTLYDDRLITGYPDLDLEKCWGQNAQSMDFVGRNGSIARLSNTVWTKEAGNTTVNLTDIWGISGSHLWATGSNVTDGHSVLLQNVGSGWNTVYDNANQPLGKNFEFSSVWTDRTSQIFLTGDGTWRLIVGQGKYQTQPTGQHWISYCIRGTNRNDIFVSGAGGEVTHFNGASWFMYQDLLAYNNATAFAYFRTVQPTSDFVLLGGQMYTGLNGFAFVIRGYR